MTRFSPCFLMGIGSLLITMTAFLTAVLPYLFYTVRLADMRTSLAVIIASIEPVVATVAGILLVPGAIVVLNVKGKSMD